MFFQVDMSPRPKKVPQKTPVEPEPENAILSLKPFTAIPKICFENVKIGTVSSKNLIIQNPTDHDIEIHITKAPPEERNVSFTWGTALIDANSECLLEIQWAPKQEGGWRDSLMLEDYRRIKKDIPLIFKAIAPKKILKKTGASKKPTLKLISKAKSPPIKTQKIVKKPLLASNAMNIPKISFNSPPKMKEKKDKDKEKENCAPSTGNNVNVTYTKSFVVVKNDTFTLNSTNSASCQDLTQEIRRDTYNVNCKVPLFRSPDSSFNDSLEISNNKNSNIQQISPLQDKVKHQKQDLLTPVVSNIAHHTHKRNHRVTFQEETTDFEQSLRAKIESQFQFSPTKAVLQTPQQNSNFIPSVCSTEEKTRDSNFKEWIEVNGRENNSNSYVYSPDTNKANISSDTYVKGNLSSETYVKNVSADTYLISPKTGNENGKQNNENVQIKREIPHTPFNLDKTNNKLPSPIFAQANTNIIHKEKESSVSLWVDSARQHLSSAGVRTVLEFGPYSSQGSKQLEMIQEESQLATPLKDCSSIMDCSSKMSLSTATIVKSYTNTNNKSSPLSRRRPSPLYCRKISPFKPLNSSDLMNQSKPLAGHENLKLSNTWSKRSSLSVKKAVKKVIPALNLTEFLQTTQQKLSEENQEAKPHKETVSRVLHDPDSLIYNVSNPMLLSSSNIDPFLMSTLFYNPKWLDEQEKMFKKWLNALLTPPEELHTNSEGENLDVAKLWQDCKRKNIAVAPTKESVSLKYHVKSRLNSLRKAAVDLFRSPEISHILSKVCMLVENNKLSIRKDKDIHLDLGLQQEILMLFLSYNPLWLRIGLETVYGSTIPLTSNSDIFGLSKFIMECFFKDEYLLKKHKASYSKDYAVDIKKFALKKFLMLVYFLDQAKTRKLISHDPCLFCKKAPVKESRNIILQFARELLSAIGDITKYLKSQAGYVLQHKQTYIHEYDFAVTCLGTDLRDGVRLTRVMELILLKENLLQQLRVPAISIMQKIHNTKVAFEALNSSGFKILYEIIPKDIVEGHKEKTLSFLWQIIYKFQAPRFMKAAVSIQIWWRSLPIYLRRLRLQRIRRTKEEAAKKIQRFYKNQKLARFLLIAAEIYKEYIIEIRQNKAALKIQSFYKMHLERKKFLAIKKSIILIQSACRRWMMSFRLYEKIEAVTTLQTYFRGYKARKEFLAKKAACTTIQRFYRSWKITQETRKEYLKIKTAILFVQIKFRAHLAMKEVRENYLTLKNSVIYIQTLFRAKLLGRKVRNEFLLKKQAAILIQEKYKALKLMQAQKIEYQELKSATVLIQRKFKANLLAKKTQNEYQKLKKSVLIIQERFRGKLLTRKLEKEFLLKKQAVILIQNKYRAFKLRKIQEKEYQELKSSAVIIQRKFRAILLARKIRNDYLSLRNVVLSIQEKFRGKLLTRKLENEFLLKKQATILIQRKWRARKACLIQKNNYSKLKQSCVLIQQLFRMKMQRRRFLLMKESVIKIQRFWRIWILTQKTRLNYLLVKKHTIIIQQRFRALIKMKKARQEYAKKLKAVKAIQSYYRGFKTTQKLRKDFLHKKTLIINLQRRFKANKLMLRQREEYKELRKATIVIQQRFRALFIMRYEKTAYLHKKQAVILIQVKFKAYLLMKQQQEDYLRIKGLIINVQRKYRANKLAKLCQFEFKRKLNACIKIQRWFRSTMLMQNQRSDFLQTLQAVKFIQQRFKANMLMKSQRMNYLLLRKNVVFVQNRFRSNLLMKKRKQEYLLMKQSVVFVQRRFRLFMAMKNDRKIFLEKRNAVVKIQKWFRCLKEMKLVRYRFVNIVNSVICIQRKYRAYKLMIKIRAEFVIKKNAAIYLQRMYRQIWIKKIAERRIARRENEAATKIQAVWRSYKVRKHSKPELMRIRQRSKQANKEAKRELTLAYRREQAFLILRSDYTTLLQIIRALEDLDYVIRRDKDNCKQMSEVLSEQLYLLISHSSRSLPEMKAATIATSILISFSKYELSYENAWQPAAISGIVDLLNHCCDKESLLFPYLCTLLWTFIHDEEKKNCFHQVKYFKKKMAKVQVLVTRMQKMVKLGANKGHSVFTPQKNYYLPSLTPDWGLEYEDRPRAFTNSVFALQKLMEILELE